MLFSWFYFVLFFTSEHTEKGELFDLHDRAQTKLSWRRPYQGLDLPGLLKGRARSANAGPLCLAQQCATEKLV